VTFEGFHEPAVAVSFSPTRAVPEIVGFGVADKMPTATFAVSTEVFDALA
jgi:hypothetical protein